MPVAYSFLKEAHKIVLAGSGMITGGRILHYLDILSGHADQQEITDWISQFDPAPDKVFLNHGERKEMRGLKTHLKTVLHDRAIYLPHEGQVFRL